MAGFWHSFANKAEKLEPKWNRGTRQVSIRWFVSCPCLISNPTSFFYKIIFWLWFCGCNTFSANCRSSPFFTNSAAATDKRWKIDSVRMFEADPRVLIQQMSSRPIECDWNRMLWVFIFTTEKSKSVFWLNWM